MNTKFLIMDVDGTLTDGKIYMGMNGELFKAFDVKDGCGIKDILPLHEIVPVIITARESSILALRCKELGIVELHQNIRQKKEKMDEILSKYSLQDKVKYSYENVAFIGDDILDLNCAIPVAEGNGVVGCPNDAVDEMINIASFVSKKNGGNGAVREFINWIIEQLNE